MLLKVLTIVVLFGIIYEDFKYRLVKVFLYLLLFIFLILLRFNELQTVDFFIFLGVNLLYILLLLIISFTYTYYKYGTLKLINHSFGIGDVFFLIAIATWFDPILFVFFNTVSFAIALTLHFLLRNLPFYNNVKSVPLAGMQGLCFIPVFMYTASY
jgi:hypothetical protein